MKIDGRYQVAGFAGWLACVLPTFLDIRAGRLTAWPAMAWATAFLAFGAVYSLYLRSGKFPRRSPVLLIVTQTAAAMTMTWTAVGMTKYLASITLAIVAGELPHVLSPRLAWAWVMAQTLLLVGIFWMSFGWLAAVAGGTAHLGFQTFALGQAFLERRERAAREALHRANAELHANRELVAESTRGAERLRISRDLHDSLGHHLTALSIQLDVAARKIDGPAANHVREAHAITRLLLSDVRDVVSQLRHASRFDLAEALRPLVASHGELRVHLDMPDALYVEDAAQAHAVLRCVQEIVTNAARHARGRQLWIRIVSDTSGIDLHAHDDGNGAGQLTWGNGLKGMRERFEAQRGGIDITTAPGQGFRIHAFMPRPEPTP